MEVEAAIESQRDVISQYIYAKDHNRPHLMASAFTSEVRLEMQVNTQNITFPAESIGLDAVTETLVRNFGRLYENVYTFCISDSFVSQSDNASCHWLVGMTEKENGCVRVGCGKYDWRFVREPSLLADRLSITIDEMLVLDACFSTEILDWVSALPYPWCDAETIVETMPELEQLSVLRQQVRAGVNQ